MAVPTILPQGMAAGMKPNLLKGGADWQGCWSALFLFLGVKRRLFGNSLTQYFVKNLKTI